MSRSPSQSYVGNNIMKTGIFSSKNHNPSAPVSTFRPSHLTYSSSLISQASSEGDTSLYALALVQDISPSKHHDPSAPVPSFRHLPHSSSLISLTCSEGDTSLYAPTFVEDPSDIDLPSQSDIIIAVMGPTGAGKSTFINKVAGLEDTGVDRGLASSTHQIQVVRCFDTQQNRQIVFVDTPGFDDTNISDFDILQVVADWLKLTYEKEIRLSGLLFFHRISDNRMGGSPIKHLKMFQNLCGIEALKNVVLVTTMWDEVDEEEGNNRENELTTRYWKTMIELGCHTSRFHNNTKSAMDIVSQFQDARCTVLLQRELVDLHLELAVTPSRTSADRTLFPFRVEFVKKIKGLLGQIEAKLRQNQHSANRIAVEQDKARTVATLRIANVQRKQYSNSSSVFRRLSTSRRLSPSAPVNARQPLTPCHLPAPDVSSITASRLKRAPVETLRGATSGPLTSSPIECFPPPPSPADSTGQSRTVLQGTITALKLIQQVIALAPVPGLQSLVGVVLNISEVVNNMYTAEDSLVELARKAGSFMVTLVEQGSIVTFSDSDSMNSVIEGLTKEMNLVLGVVTKISSQRSATRHLLSAFDRAAVDECNRQMALACAIFGIRTVFISQQAIARIEAKLNLALKIPQESNKQTTTARRKLERASTF